MSITNIHEFEQSIEAITSEILPERHNMVAFQPDNVYSVKKTLEILHWVRIY